MSDALSIENIVATAELGVALDLAALEAPLEADPFDAERFPGLVVRSRGTTFLVFPDGRIRLTGPKSTDEAKKRLQSLTEQMGKNGVRLEKQMKYWVDNLVVSADLGARAPLDQIALAMGEERTVFDPESFPGLVHRVQDPPVTILLFTSGRLVATGVGDTEALRKAVRDFVGELRSRRLVVAAEGS